MNINDILDEFIPIYTQSFWCWLFGALGQWGVTINGKVHITGLALRNGDDAQLAALVAHEYVHVEQQQSMGWWRFLATYLIYWPWYVWRIRDHPLERPAYARGAEVYDAMIFLQENGNE